MIVNDNYMKKISAIFEFLSVLIIGILISVSVCCADAEIVKGNALIISEIRVTIAKKTVGDEHDSSLGQMAYNLIVLKKGERFSPALLDESIRLLQQSGKSKEINVDSKEEDGNIILFFHLTPYRWIKDIRISGRYPVFEREVLAAMTIYPGNAFVQEALKKQEAGLVKLYKNEGYIEPHVSIVADEDPADGNYIIKVKIDKGPFYSLKTLDFTGNNNFSTTRLKWNMKIWRDAFFPASSGRFIEADFKKDIDELTKFYRINGFADVEIQPVIKKDSKSHTVSISLLINEGPCYHIIFLGNKAFWDSTLKKDLILLRDGNRNGLGLKRSIRKIKELYQSSGYLSTKIKAEEQAQSGKEDIRKIRIVIEENPKTIVDSVEIEGNVSYPESRIRKQMLTETDSIPKRGIFVPAIFEEDISAIQEFYISEGFMSPEVKQELEWNRDRSRVKIRIRIKEGVRTMVSSVKISGSKVLTSDDAFKVIALKEKQPFQKYMIRKDENALSRLISNKGYPYVKVKGEIEFASDRKQAKITYTITDGIYVSMGEVYLKGNLRTKDQAIEKEMEIRPGEPFSLEKMLLSQRNIRNLDIFKEVGFKTLGLKAENDRINLMVDVEEQKPYFIELGFGYDSSKEFYARTGIGDHNLFGLNKYGWISGEISQAGYKSEIGISEPRFLDTYTSASIKIYAEQVEEFNENFGYKALGTSLSLSPKAIKNFTPGLNFSLERRDQYRLDSSLPFGTVISEEEYQKRSILVITPSLTYNTRDSFIRPKTGVFSSLHIDISKGLENSFDDFIKYRYDLRYYYTPAHPLTLAFLGRAGYIKAYGNMGQVPQDQLFFLGGTFNVRGFEENLLRFDSDGNAVGGRSAISGSMEARIDLGANIEMTAFYDMGSVSKTFVEAGSDKFRSSAGLGLRYITPIGPIGILYGHKLDREKGESAGQIHFSVGYTF
ncbi:MAG: outer membrane protein assembly factor BamA [Desulfobacterium sp.]|nr:outer membrane protein assembly factor BamA [Desulfobacterium sp.]